MAEYGVPNFNGGSRKHLESLIPILILVIIGIVLLGKTTNILCSVPGLSSVFCGGEQVKILILGDFSGVTVVDAPELKKVLEGQVAHDYHLQYVTATPDLIGTTGSLLKGFDVVVMVGEREYTRSAKDRVGEYIRGGGKVILIGDAGTTDPDEPGLQGWGIIGEAPVELGFEADLEDPLIFTDKKTDPKIPLELKIVDIFNDIVKDYGPRFELSKISDTKASCKDDLPVVDVNIANGGSPLAFISGAVQQEDSTYVKTVRPAVVTRDTGFLGGKVVYFAFDPGCTQNMFLATIKWLTGKGL